MQPLCDLRDAMPLPWLPLPLPREAEDWCASTHMADLRPTKRYYLVGSIYVLGTAIEYYINLSLVLNSLYY